MNLKIRTLTFLVAIVATIAHAEEIEKKTKPENRPHPDIPMLWRVEGNELEKPAYLFGTIHITAQSVVSLHPRAQEAFESATTLFTESSMDPRKRAALASKLVRRDGSTLEEELGPEQSLRLKTWLQKIAPSMRLTHLQSYQTWAVALNLGSLGGPDIRAKAARMTLDQSLWVEAKKRGLNVNAVESAETQYSFFESLDKKESAQLLFSMTERVEASKKKSGEKNIFEIYLDGDLKALTQKTTIFDPRPYTSKQSRKIAERLHQYMVKERNKMMTKTIAETLKSSPHEAHFFAVGCSHLVGEESICELLQDMGYKVNFAGK